MPMRVKTETFLVLCREKWQNMPLLGQKSTEFERPLQIFSVPFVYHGITLEYMST